MLKSEELPTSCEQLQCLSTRLGRRQPNSPLNPAFCDSFSSGGAVRLPSSIAGLPFTDCITCVQQQDYRYTSRSKYWTDPRCSVCTKFGRPVPAGRCTHSLLCGYNSKMDL